MKKKYEAPEVEVIRYSLHEASAAGCANKVFNHTTECCQDDPTDFGQFLLGMGVTFAEDTCGSGGLQGYCYFTSSQTLFNS